MSCRIVFDDSITHVRPAPRLDDPALEARVPWTGEVVAFDGDFLFCLQAIELGRTTLLATGDVLEQGSHVTLTLELEGERVYVLAHVEWSAIAGEVAICRLRLGVTSPRGNELLTHLVRAGIPRAQERVETEEIALHDDDVTALWRREGDTLRRVRG